VRFPAIAEGDEIWALDSELGQYLFTRQRGEALHPERTAGRKRCKPVWIPGSISRRQSLQWLVDSEWQSRDVAHFKNFDQLRDTFQRRNGVRRASPRCQIFQRGTFYGLSA
jgi:hypothetical protein